MDKIDGPYYFFKLIQRLRGLLPPWAPMIGLEGGRINLVPVDFVVSALDHLAHPDGLDGRCFHLVDPHPRRVGDILHCSPAPPMRRRSGAPQRGPVGLPARVLTRAGGADPGAPHPQGDHEGPRPARRTCCNSSIIPPVSTAATPNACSTRPASRFRRLEAYAWRLWDYWERHLDPDLFIDRSLRGRVAGKVVLVTGGSAGSARRRR